jgi:4-amino-4-deoxy-L-arabinose transferase-like glycosyltransferase
MATNNSVTTAKLLPRAELFWLAGAIIFGSILRLGYPGRMAIEHFDEGVYASNFWFGGEPYPAQHLYAPPLLPTAIEWTMIVASICGFKPTGFIPIIPSLIAGIATIPSIWWVGRRWFGATASLTSAWLVATSDFHVCYSRAALTDVPVCVFMLWAVYFIWRTFERATMPPEKSVERGKQKASSRSPLPWSDILLAGLFTGLAWWTKYNGWLPLAIGLAGGAFWQFLTPKKERQIGRTLTCWGLVASVAFLIWSPVLWHLQDQKYGGYASVAANHRQYIVGLKGWTNSAQTQMCNIGTYENPLDIFYAPFRNQNSLRQDFVPDMQTIVSYARVGQWRFAFETLHRMLFKTIFILFAPIGSLVICSWICFRKSFLDRNSTELIPACLAVAWFVGMTFATPMYHPYPRLVFPWLFSTWILIGAWFQSWRERASDGRSGELKKRRIQMLAGMLVVVTTIRILCGSAHAWRDRTGVQQIAERFARSIKQEVNKLGSPGNKSLTIVLGEPALVFGLYSEGLTDVWPGQDLESALRVNQATTFVCLSTDFLASMPQDDRERLTRHFERAADSQFPNRSHLVLNEKRKNGQIGNVTLFRLVR